MIAALCSFFKIEKITDLPKAHVPPNVTNKDQIEQWYKSTLQEFLKSHQLHNITL